MARPIKELSGNYSDVQRPKLSDFASQNYANVMQKTMDNYAQAMKAITAKQEVEASEWRRLQQQALAAEKAREASHRANQSKGGGGNILGKLADFGQTILSGVMAQEELNYKRDMAERDMSLREKKWEFEKDSVVDEQAFQQVSSMIDTRLGQVEEQFYETAIDFSSEEGYAQLDNTFYSVFPEEEVALLSPRGQQYLNQQWQKVKTGILKSQQGNIQGERQARQDSSRSLATETWLGRSNSILNQIETGALSMSPDEVADGVEATTQQALEIMGSRDYSSIFRDPQQSTKFLTDVLRRQNATLTAYYQATGKTNDRTIRLQEAMNQVSMLESMVGVTDDNTGQPLLTESEFAYESKLILSGLGIDSDVNDLPTTRVNVQEAEIRRRETARNFSRTIREDQKLRELATNDPSLVERRKYYTGEVLFNTLTNQSARTPEETIAYYESLKELDPVAYEDANGSVITKYLKEFDDDKLFYNNTRQKISTLKQQLAKLSNPETERAVTIMPDGLNDREGAVVETIPVPEPIPRATPEELEEIRTQIKLEESKLTDLTTKWKRVGINLSNPSDPSFLDELRERTQASEDVVSQSSVYRQSNTGVTSQTDNQVIQQTQNTNTTVSRLNKALGFEVGKVGLGHDSNIIGQITGKTVQKPDGSSTRLYTVEDLEKHINSFQQMDKVYDKTLADMISAYSKGEDYDTTKFRERIEALSTSDDPVVTEVINTLDENILKVNKLLENKSRWYRQAWGERQASRAPTNFSSGSPSPEPVRLPNNVAPSQPGTPLSGVLASTKYGFAPFSGGNVQFTSDAGIVGKTRFGSNRPRHNGVDMVSDDPRVATIQGGTVVVADASGKLNPNGFGRAVIVKTPDGRYELFGHLDSVGVKEGDTLKPGTQIGIMGNTGRGTGAHLHFSVGKSWKGNLLLGDIEDPIAYMGMFTGTVENPRGRGATPSGAPDNAVGYSTQPGAQGYVMDTGLTRMSNGLVYGNGYVFDPNTRKVRRATERESANVTNYVPITTTVNRGVNTTQTTRTQNTQVRETEVTEWVVPDQAKQEGTYLFVYPTGRTSTRGGQPVLAVEGWKGGKKLFSVEAVSGATGIGGNRTQSGLNGMLPDGRWRVSRDTTPGTVAGVGDLFMPLTPMGNFAGNRSAIGIHWDADRDGDTAGCLATLTKQDRDKIYNFVRSSNQMYLYVNTTNKTTRIERSEQQVTPSNQSNSQRTSYTSSGRVRNDPSSNYGYKELREDPKLAQAFAEAGDKLGIPAQWIVDVIDTESTGFGNPDYSVDGLSVGIFQLTHSNRERFHPGMSAKEYVQKGKYWQITDSFVKYIKQVEKDVGKKISSVQDLVLAIWYPRGIKYTPQERHQKVYAAGSWGRLSWAGKMSKVGQRVGRRYSPDENTTTIKHTNPRQNCPTCNQMQLNGRFQPHDVRF